MILFFAALLIVAAIVERWSMRNTLDSVEYDCTPSKRLVEPDERLEVLTSLINRRRSFVPFLSMEEKLPTESAVHTEGVMTRVDALGTFLHCSRVYLRPRQRLERSIVISLPKRGRYFFRGAHLKGGDFLGLKEWSAEVRLTREVVVFPRESDNHDALQVLGGFLGDVSVRRFIMEDPVLTAGFREYTGREPMKAIAWRQSASAGQLMVRQYDYTLEPSVSVLLDVHNGSDNSETLVEECYRLTRSVCQALEDRRIKYDFFTNAIIAGAFSGWPHMAEGLGHHHFTAILEGLGRATLQSAGTLARIVSVVAKTQEAGRSAIVITPQDSPETREALRPLKERTGGLVHVITPREDMA